MSGDDTLFVREATGLVREWSSYDAWVYAFLSVNVVTLGFYIWTFNAFLPSGSPILGTLIAVVMLTLQNVVYATLVSSMPRVGGDYVWQSRLLGGFWGWCSPGQGGCSSCGSGSRSTEPCCPGWCWPPSPR